MAENIKVSLILDDKEYTGKIQQAGKDAENLGTKVAKAGDISGTGFGKVTSAVSLLQSKMAGLSTVLLGAGFAEMAHKALALGDDISDLSKGTDVSILRILQLREAFAASGGNAEGLGKILNKLNITLYDAQEGGALAQEALIKLGFSFKEMANLNTDQALQKVIDKLAGISDPVERNALAFKTLGKEAKNIDWAGIRDGTTNTSSEMARYAQAIEEAGAAHDKLQAASEKLTLAFVGLLETTGVLDFINNMNNDMAKFEKVVVLAGLALATYFGAAFVLTLGEIASGVWKMVTAFEALGVAMAFLEKGTAVGRLFAIGTAIGLAVGSYFGLMGVMDAVDNKNKAQNDEALAQQKKLEEARIKAQGGGSKAAVSPAWAKEIVALDTISDIYAKTNQEIIDKVNLETDSFMLSVDEVKKRQELYDLGKAYNKQLDDINAKLKQEEASPQSAAGDARIKQLKTEQDQVKAIYNADKVRLAETRDNNRRVSREFSTGWGKAWNEYVDNATNASEQAKKIVQTMTQSMEDSLFNFFKTGKFGFKEMIQTMVDTLLRSQIQQLMGNVMGTMAQPTAGAGSAGGSGGGIGSIFSGIGKLLGFADGGTIPTNAPVLVGERGPEILSGAGGRTVTPNNQIGNSVTYNINAVDAMSFKQMIAADPSFLYAVSEQGRRRLPGSR